MSHHNIRLRNSSQLDRRNGHKKLSQTSPPVWQSSDYLSSSLSGHTLVGVPLKYFSWFPLYYYFKFIWISCSRTGNWVKEHRSVTNDGIDSTTSRTVFWVPRKDKVSILDYVIFYYSKGKLKEEIKRVWLFWWVRSTRLPGLSSTEYLRMSKILDTKIGRIMFDSYWD